MLKKLSGGYVHPANGYLPDLFIFCLILTFIVFIAAIASTAKTPVKGY